MPWRLLACGCASLGGMDDEASVQRRNAFGVGTGLLGCCKEGCACVADRCRGACRASASRQCGLILVRSEAPAKAPGHLLLDPSRAHFDMRPRACDKTSAAIGNRLKRNATQQRQQRHDQCAKRTHPRRRSRREGKVYAIRCAIQSRESQRAVEVIIAKTISTYLPRLIQALCSARIFKQVRASPDRKVDFSTKGQETTLIALRLQLERPHQQP
jgi:hypothetical protein